MNKYDELMNRIEVSPEMRSRLLSNINAAVTEDEQQEPEQVRTQEPEGRGSDLGSRRIKRIVRVAVPLAAVAAVVVFAVVFGSRLFGAKGGASGAAPAYDQQMAAGGGADKIAEDAGAGYEYEMEAAEETRAASAEGIMDIDETARTMSEYPPEEATATENAASSAKTTDALEAVPYNVFYTNHHTPLTGAEYPSVTLVTSRKQLEETFMTDNYDDALAAQEYLSEMECSEFTDEYFKTKDVLVILLEEGSGSTSHTLTAIDRADTSSPWKVHIKRYLPEIGTDDMAYWYIVAEIDKGILSDSEIELSVE